eukprot:TRINITY_DN2923_c0_g2_i1.p1 TRINITY_DN2923_c0_g2~~TRINITY_DN2923_c0_g2_i1.p1  ORF type:complete len:401 (+),score=59.69 TRINITY_DN2923_c0_g2_i1:64-1266(+)
MCCENACCSIIVLAFAMALPLLMGRSMPLAALNSLYPIGVNLMEDTRIPDQLLDVFLRPALRIGFWALVAEQEQKFESNIDSQAEYVKQLKSLPIALFTGEANEQHYEVETQFFDVALGSRKKYSSGLWGETFSSNPGGAMMEQAEDAMLDLYVQRAGIKDGQRILDLGCGWGSVSLYLAERFPKSEIIGVSNSRTQREYIMGQAATKGFKNLQIQTLNVASPGFQQLLEPLSGTIDRIISIEMFEHMKNYEKLLKLLSRALKPTGKLFLQIFCHKYLAYNFEEDDLNAWMTANFFKGGTMPSQFLLQHFQDDLTLRNQWNVNGRNYSLTLEGWLERIDNKKEQLLAVFRSNTSSTEASPTAALQIRRWRIFMIACSEFFSFRGGTEFFLTHLLFEKSKE